MTPDPSSLVKGLARQTTLEYGRDSTRLQALTEVKRRKINGVTS